MKSRWRVCKRSGGTSGKLVLRGRGTSAKGGADGGRVRGTSGGCAPLGCRTFRGAARFLRRGGNERSVHSQRMTDTKPPLPPFWRRSGSSATAPAASEIPLPFSPPLRAETRQMSAQPHARGGHGIERGEERTAVRRRRAYEKKQDALVRRSRVRVGAGPERYVGVAVPMIGRGGTTNPSAQHAYSQSKMHVCEIEEK